MILFAFSSVVVVALLGASMVLTSIDKSVVERLYEGIISSLSLREIVPSEIRAIKPERADHIQHFIFYSMLGAMASFMAMMFFRVFKEKSSWLLFARSSVIGLTGTCIWAGFEELKQLFVPTRVADFSDFLASATGATAGGLLFFGGMMIFSQLFSRRIIKSSEAKS